MIENERSTGQTDPSKLLDLFDKFSLSKSLDDNVKDQGIDVSPTSSTQSDQSPTSSSSDTPSPPSLAQPSSDQASISSRRDRQAIEAVPSSYERLSVTWNGFSFHLPFSNDHIIDVMEFRNCNLVKSFSNQTSSLTQPERLGYFSCHIKEDGQTQSYHPDKSSIRYLHYHPNHKLNMNLLEGFSDTENWGRVPPGEMHLLRWFNDNIFDSSDDNDNNTIDFISYTRMLRSIMNAPYNFSDDWICIAIKVRGSIIIDEVDTPARQESTKKQNYNQRASSYAGYKFEEMITRGYDGIHRPTHAKGNRDSFYIVSKAKLNNHTILYTNRVDCALNKDQLHKNVSDMKFAQIKTRGSSFYKSQAARNFFCQRRVITWWIESWLGNIELIICGEKDDSYHVNKVTRMKVENIPHERNRWSPRTCVSFLDLVLTFIKEMVTEELTVYRFYCVPGQAIVCQRINEPVEKYLPTWFINDEEPDND